MHVETFCGPIHEGFIGNRSQRNGGTRPAVPRPPLQTGVASQFGSSRASVASGSEP
jgi:hypothetical protein